MEHFYQNIHGWFSYDYIYKEVVDMAEDGDLLVEIGSFKGKSSAYMAVELLNSGKKVRFDCIDPCKLLSHYADAATANPGEWEGYSADEFHQRLEPVKGYYNLVQLTSTDAATTYADKSIDFIMIDGDHSYEGVKADVLNFLPKMKSGGIMTGDDAWSPEVWKAVTDAVPQLKVSLIGGKHFYIEIP